MTGKYSRALGALAPLLLAFALFPTNAHAVFERVGPTSAVNGYPLWYQDKTGITLELCTPTTQAELVGGHCLLLPGDTTAPEVFPTSWFDEHFYWDGSTVVDLPLAPGATRAGRAVLVQALEGAFATGPVIPGEQIVFGRFRFDFRDLPLSGTYTIYTPFGIRVFPDLAGGVGTRLFYTEDIGLTCTLGDFTCALQAGIGPFLLPSAVPGGPEEPPFIDPLIPGKRYIADPARLGPVTGSVLPDYVTPLGTFNANLFRIEVTTTTGVVEIVNTPDFGLVGRLYQDPIPSRVAVDRASYTREPSGDISLDVYATGEPTLVPRLPGSAPSAKVFPDLAFFSAPCTGTPDPLDPLIIGPPFSAPAGTSVPMARFGTSYYGHTVPGAVPAGVCVANLNATAAGGGVVPHYDPAPVGDQVFISEAIYDQANGGSLSVRAVSSDRFAPPELSVGAFGDLATNPVLSNGVTLIAPLPAVPSKIRVLSQEGGNTEIQVAVGRRLATGVGLTSAPLGVQFEGQPVTFTAAGQGSTGYQYRFWLSSDGGVNYAIAQDWSNAATFVLPGTTSAGTYSVFADVRTNTTATVPDATSLAVSVTIRLPAATGVLITANRPSPSAVNLVPVPTIFTAEGQGSAGYDYRFWLSTNGGAFVLVQNYGGGATWQLPASTPPGSYQVKVDVRTSAIVSQDATNTVPFQLVNPTPATGVTLTPAPISPSLPGTNVVFTAVGTGSTSAGVPTPANGYAYRFWLKIGTGPFTIVQDYGVGSTYTLVAPVAGSYQVAVHVRTTGTVAADVFGPALGHTVAAPAPTKALTLTLLRTPGTPSAAGTDVVFTGVGGGSTTSGVPTDPAVYQYRFFLKIGTAPFVQVQDYGVSDTYTLAAPVAGAYQVAVWVRTTSTVTADIFGPALGHTVQ